MTLLRKLLGEAGDADDALIDKIEGDNGPASEPEENAETEQETGQEPSEIEPETQELIDQWKQGKRIDVAAKLMFTSASYAGFVDLIFAIGQSDGKALGQMLDEIADTRDIEPPQTPPEYKNMLQRVGSANEEEDVI